MPDSEPVHQHAGRGLDHGAWVPLKVMYPDGDVPVLRLSMPTHDPARLLDIGRRLRPLRDQGILVIGSGFMTHGLPYLTREMLFQGAVPSWSFDFAQWVADALARGDVDTLAGYRSKAPGLPYAHPTIEGYFIGACPSAPSKPPEVDVHEPGQHQEGLGAFVGRVHLGEQVDGVQQSGPAARAQGRPAGHPDLEAKLPVHAGSW